MMRNGKIVVTASDKLFEDLILDSLLGKCHGKFISLLIVEYETFLSHNMHSHQIEHYTGEAIRKNSFHNFSRSAVIKIDKKKI